MENIDDQFMKDLEEARNLLPVIHKLLIEPGYIPDDLDNPCDQQEIENLFAFGSELARLSLLFSNLSVRLCIGMPVQKLYDEKENEEEEEGVSHEEKMREFCLKESDF